MWECCKCHEKIDDAFDVCWKCGTSIDGVEDPSFQSADDQAPPTDLRETPTEKRGAEPDKLMVCPRCKSRDIIPGVRVVDRSGQLGTVKNNLEVEVCESPDALIFKGAHSGTLTASVCGKCGYTELYVSNAAELLETYQKSKRRKPQ
jgi:hypothetical protein